MFGKIIYIGENIAHVENQTEKEKLDDLMNMHVIFAKENQNILGEVSEINDTLIKIRFLGEFINNKYVNGIIRKPSLNSQIRVINQQELLELVGSDTNQTLNIGTSSLYKDFGVYADVNNLFANHMAVFGNSGSGKSWGMARLVQNIFANPNNFNYNANIFIFDAYGEYKNAFKQLNALNQYYEYKFITTNPTDADDNVLKLPFHLLNLDDISLLLQASSHSQLPILEKALQLAKIFAQKEEVIITYKNHLIAKAIIAILYSNNTSLQKKNQIFQIIEICHTDEFNFNTGIQGVGYVRNFSKCFEIDLHGNFSEILLMTDYVLKFINDDLDMAFEPKNAFYGIEDFQKALNFTLISEGFQDNKQIYDDAMLLKVRLSAIINSKMVHYFKVKSYISPDNFIASLVNQNNKRAQIINLTLEDLTDAHSKSLVKIFCRMFFDFSKSRKERASIPFHLFLEEAHRYIQNDNDTYLIGYNIFNRIAKEGRKYGILLNIVSQRPVEISDTVISQCSNFLIFKMTHPMDIDYIEKMLPNISTDIIEKQKVLQPGICVGFGSAFKIPMIIKMSPPQPAPNSTSCDVVQRWKVVE